MPTVRTAMQPDREIEVSDAEAEILGKQGLLAPDEDPEPKRPARPARPSSNASTEA